LDSDVMSAPIAVDDEVYATSFSGVVYRFKQGDGALISAHRSRATSAPVIVGGNVYLTKRADVGGQVAEAIAGEDRATAVEKFASNRKEAKYLDASVQTRSLLKGQAMGLTPAMALLAEHLRQQMPRLLSQRSQDNVASMQAFQGSRVLHCPAATLAAWATNRLRRSSGRTKAMVGEASGDLEKQGDSGFSPPLLVVTFSSQHLRRSASSRSVSGKLRNSYSVGRRFDFSRPSKADESTLDAGW